jgi:hypothetical protein
MSDLFVLLASFTHPIEIGTTPGSVLWMFPLLAAIFWNRFLRESAILVITVSLFMVVTAVALNVIVWWFT